MVSSSWSRPWSWLTTGLLAIDMGPSFGVAGVGCGTPTPCAAIKEARAGSAARRDDVPHAPARIRMIAAIARDQVPVRVGNRLARRRPFIDADVVAVGAVRLRDLTA